MSGPCCARAARSRPGEQGFVVVAVLWILAALTVLVSVYAVHVIDTGFGSKLGETRLEVEALIRSGLELATDRLIPVTDRAPPSSGTFGFRIGRAKVEVIFVSEGARVDLNEAKKPLLAGLLSALGAGTDEAAGYADMIVGWRTAPDVASRNEPADFFDQEGSGARPRKGPFQTVAELRLVPGLPPEFVDRMMPFVTIFNGRPEIDPMVADPTVLRAVPNIGPGALQEILEKRSIGDAQRVLDLLSGARSIVAVQPRKATRLAIRIDFDDGRKVRAEVVIILMDGGSDPYRILAWQDDFDAPGA